MSNVWTFIFILFFVGSVIVGVGYVKDNGVIAFQGFGTTTVATCCAALIGVGAVLYGIFK